MLSKVLKYSIFLLFLMFFSCSQESNVLLNSVEDYSLESVEDGAFLEPGSSVNIVFTEIGSRAKLVHIVLEDAAGMEIASAEVEPEMLKGIGMPMDLPADLEDGIYYLRFTVMDGDIQLFQDQRYFFLAGGIYNISSLETYPPGIKAGDIISARIILTSPVDSDPWLRWTLAGEVLLEGFLSKIGTTCSFSVPEEGGVYSLRVEVFPVSPQDRHISSIYRHSDLFVTSGEGDDVPWKFIEDRTYLYFIEFKDDLSNRMNPSDVPELIGDPLPSSLGGFSGISFSENDGLLFTDYALPLYADGSSEDFLMAMAFSYTELPETGEYNIFRTGDEYNHFSVRYLAETAEFLAEFKSYSHLFQSYLPIDSIQSNEAVFLELSYNSKSEVAALSWMNNGSVIVRDEGIPLDSFIEGNTLIGSDGSFSGLPMTWYTFSVSTETYDSANQVVSPSDSPPVDELSDERILYERSDAFVSEISIEKFIPGTGLATMVILSDPGAGNDWIMTISDSKRDPLYSLAPMKDVVYNPVSDSEDESVEEVSGKSDIPVKIVLSLINDDRGFFLSSSADQGMTGPFAFQDILNIKIADVTDGSVNNIRNIRFFQD
ncbi:hypothetical protein DV872_22740 [Oceanispirochaeta sp. M1]|nr:hypothetical protein DV872_22740 [Oceanispirochaeta sp. M1]